MFWSRKASPTPLTITLSGFLVKKRSIIDEDVSGLDLAIPLSRSCQ